LLFGAGEYFKAAGAEPKPATKELISFGTLRQPSLEVAKADAQAWLKAAGKTDADSQKAFDAVWSSDRPLLDKVADTFALGNADAKALLNDARNGDAAAPTEVPALLKDAKLPPYFRANLGLAYAKALSNRRVYEESGAVLKLFKADQTVDPGAYYFHKAVAEHALMMRPQADEDIGRLLDDVGDAPERYRMVGALMHFDMLTWNDKDLGWVARKMDNIQRRLDLVRGGKETQRIQKEVIVRLDEMIKELENQNQGNGS